MKKPGIEYLSNPFTNLKANINERVEKNKLLKARKEVYWKSIGKYPINFDVASFPASVVYKALSQNRCIIVGNTINKTDQKR